MLIANNQRQAGCGGTCERDLCETMTSSRLQLPGKMRKHRCPFGYLASPSWLRSVLSRTGRP